MNEHRRSRIALWGAVAGGLAGLMAIIGGNAQPTGGQPLTVTPAVMAEMHPQAAAHAPQGTVVRLHQRVVRLSIQNLAFQPARIVVSPGTRIVWTNLDGFAHTVTSDKGIWSSSDVESRSQFARVFSTTGAFPYHCSIHPFMHGTVTVKK